MIKRPWTSAKGGATAVILGPGVLQEGGRGLLCAAVAEVLYWLSVGGGGGGGEALLQAASGIV